MPSASILMSGNVALSGGSRISLHVFSVEPSTGLPSTTVPVRYCSKVELSEKIEPDQFHSLIFKIDQRSDDTALICTDDRDASAPGSLDFDAASPAPQ